MSDNQDPLSQLWQSQKVESPDINAIKKKWQKVKLKQRFYMSIDLVSTLMVFVILYFFGKDMDNFTYKMFLGLSIICVGYLAYVAWLRRFSIGWSDLAAELHIQKLKKQISNNIKIANLSKYSVYLILVFIVMHQVGMFYFEVFEPEKLVRKALLSLVFYGIGLPLLWIDRKSVV